MVTTIIEPEVDSQMKDHHKKERHKSTRNDEWMRENRANSMNACVFKREGKKFKKNKPGELSVSI